MKTIQEILAIVRSEGYFEYDELEMVKLWGIGSLRLRLHRAFRYDFETGNLYWRVSSRRSKIGDLAGCLDKEGYRVIRFDGKQYKAHRLILIMFDDNYAESLEVDHINRNPSDNRLENLRIVSKSVNLRNQKIPKNNKSGHVGIIEISNGFSIYCQGRYIGRSKPLKNAILIRDKIYQSKGFNPNHGKQI